MPKLNLPVNPFKKGGEKIDLKTEIGIKLVEAPNVPIVPSTGFLQMCFNGFSYANEWVMSFFDYAWPVSWRRSSPDNEADRRTLAEQKLKEQKRTEFNQSVLRRKRTLRNNHNADVARVKTKTDICNNWGKEEIAVLQDQLEKLRAINPCPELDLTEQKIPGWDVNPGDSQFRGVKELCRSLQCSDSNQIAPVVSNFDNSNFFINQLQELESEKQSCVKENIYLSNQYRELRNSIEQKAQQMYFQRQNNNYQAIENNNYRAIESGRN